MDLGQPTLVEIMYPARFVQYVNLPDIPQDILQSISVDPQHYEFDHGSYWTDQHNQALNAWAQKNICTDMYFAFQCFTNSVNMHKDLGTQIKLNYIVQPGGTQVVTEFYGDDQTTKLDQYIIEPGRWHLFRANVNHCVRGIEPGQVRFAITARVF